MMPYQKIQTTTDQTKLKKNIHKMVLYNTNRRNKRKKNQEKISTVKVTAVCYWVLWVLQCRLLLLQADDIQLVLLWYWREGKNTALSLHPVTPPKFSVTPTVLQPTDLKSDSTTNLNTFPYCHMPYFSWYISCLAQPSCLGTSLVFHVVRPP